MQSTELCVMGDNTETVPFPRVWLIINSMSAEIVAIVLPQDAMAAAISPYVSQSQVFSLTPQ